MNFYIYKMENTTKGDERDDWSAAKVKSGMIRFSHVGPGTYMYLVPARRDDVALMLASTYYHTAAKQLKESRRKSIPF